MHSWTLATDGDVNRQIFLILAWIEHVPRSIFQWIDAGSLQTNGDTQGVGLAGNQGIRVLDLTGRRRIVARKKFVVIERDIGIPARLTADTLLGSGRLGGRQRFDRFVE